MDQMCTGNYFIHKKFEFPLNLILNVELFLFIMIRYAEASMQRLPASTKNPPGRMVGAGRYSPGDDGAFYAKLFLGWWFERIAAKASFLCEAGRKVTELKGTASVTPIRIVGE